MIKYDKLTDTLRKGKKSISASSKNKMQVIAQYVIELTARGEPLDGLPLNSKIIPPLHEILTYIQGNDNLRKELQKAEVHRTAALKEKMIGAAKRYAQNPSPENKDVFAAAEKTFTNVAKSAPPAESNVSITFHSNMPEDFWK